MSEFTNNAEKRIANLTAYMVGLMENENGADLVNRYQIQTTRFVPSDLLVMFDRIFDQQPDMEELKTASNKLFNILYKTLTDYPSVQPAENSFIHVLMQNNKSVISFLNETKPLIKQINNEISEEKINELLARFTELQKFTSHYVIKENILFPYIEENWNNNSCLKLMWSLHDDVRRNIKSTLELLNQQSFDLKTFNKVSSKVFFNINTIKFREEKVLFPVLLEKIDTQVLADMLHQSREIGLAFVDIGTSKTAETITNKNDGFIHFKTGILTIEQAELIFNHLPVDITFVDETDTVKYFSTPKHRIFPRSTGIIGRKVQNCHPHESVDVVNRIVDSFRKGEKDVASFWIHMGSSYVRIQYFAVRDKNGFFKGTLEVSQEISGLQKITGDKRLLDWEQ